MSMAEQHDRRQYGGGEETRMGRSFVKSTLARAGLNSGDVVAFKVKGVYLAAVQIPIASSESSSGCGDLYTLAPCENADPEDVSVHLEIVRHGEWVGFRSMVANNAMLQAKKKGMHKIAFYSPRFGIYEQWNVVEGSALDRIHWNSTVVTLQNRKLTHCEMRVQMHRLGVVEYTSGSSLVHKGHLTSSLETGSIQTMSGMMVQEWIRFVEKEKQRRMVLEARVEKAVEDVEGLRQWAAQQVQCARKDVQEEIELLLEALNDKNEALADVHARLTTRIQWGAALLETKKATILGRRVLIAWKMLAARSKYCDTVVLKMRRRNQVRMALRVLDAWGERVVEKAERRRKLRVGVRRMSVLRMQNAFVEWRRVSEESRDKARAEESLNNDATLIAQSQLAKRVFSAWKKRSARSREAQRILVFAGMRYEENLSASVFRAWRNRTVEIKIQAACLEHRVSMRQRRQQQADILRIWRVTVDDVHAEKIEYERSVNFDVAWTRRRVFAAWKERLAQVAVIESHVADLEHRRMQELLHHSCKLWRNRTAFKCQRRRKLIEFVQSRAERCMEKALWFWKEHAAYKTRARLHIDAAQKKRDQLIKYDALAWWRSLAHEGKMHRKLVGLCVQRRERKQVKDAFAAWRATNQKSNRTFMNLINYTDVWSKKRMRSAFDVLRNNAKENMREHALHVKAAHWHSGRLCARAFWALGTAVENHNRFKACLENIKCQMDQKLKRAVWQSWMFEVEETSGRNANCHNFKLRKEWHSINQVFVSWRRHTSMEKYLNNVALTGKARVDESRAQWAFGVWLQVSRSQISDRLQEQKADAWRVMKTMNRVVKGWKSHTEIMKDVSYTCDVLFERKTVEMRARLFTFWKSLAAYNKSLAQSAYQIMDGYAERLQRAAFTSWKNKCDDSSARILQLHRAILKLSEVRSRQAFQHWRQVSEDAAGKSIYLNRMEVIYMKRNRRHELKEAFTAWRCRLKNIQSGVAAFDQRRQQQLQATKRIAFSSWNHQASYDAFKRQKSFRMIVQKRASQCITDVFIAWRYETQVQTRNSLVVLHAVDRLSFKLMKQSFFSWRIAAFERKERRMAMVEMMEESFRRRLGVAFKAWRDHSAEQIRIRKKLEHCILQKKIAYDLYRQSYWENVDEELQETLGAMLEDTATEVDADNSIEHVVEKNSHERVSYEKNTFASNFDLDSISEAFEQKRQELSVKVRHALQQSSMSPGHALTPPKRELHVLEPLQYLLSTKEASEGSTAAESLSFSEFSISDLENDESIDLDTELLDIGDFSPSPVSAEKTPTYPNHSIKASQHYSSVKHRAIPDHGTPESPRILAAGPYMPFSDIV
ncbi:hypothetical protein PSENEW3_00000509 [Picochlorum sp. SENEW3]|nr:hypothetical protein PSENEW3_00000509 [Picochlorum sp. SENEW3]